MSEEKKPFHNPFAALSSLRGTLPDLPAKVTTPPPVAPPPGAPQIARAVVRIERAGRSGKEVTVVEHLELRPMDREKWLKALKAALGCGGSLEGDAIVLQGDHRKRLPAILTSRGVKKVTVG